MKKSVTVSNIERNHATWEKLGHFGIFFSIYVRKLWSCFASFFLVLWSGDRGTAIGISLFWPIRSQFIWWKRIFPRNGTTRQRDVQKKSIIIYWWASTRMQMWLMFLMHFFKFTNTVTYTKNYAFLKKYNNILIDPEMKI